MIYKSGRPLKYNPYNGKGKCPPNEPGEYRIRDENGVIAYLGITNELDRRMREHKAKNGKLQPGDTFEYKTSCKYSTIMDRRRHEMEKIREHRPYRNTSTGGEGRIAVVSKSTAVQNMIWTWWKGGKA